jgi:hypothetical protein
MSTVLAILVIAGVAFGIKKYLDSKKRVPNDEKLGEGGGSGTDEQENNK